MDSKLAEQQLEKVRGLSKRQREVFQLFCQGMRFTEIAARLELNYFTVQHDHMVPIYEKLGSRDRVSLYQYRWAIDQLMGGEYTNDYLTRFRYTALSLQDKIEQHHGTDLEELVEDYHVLKQSYAVMERHYRLLMYELELNLPRNVRRLPPEEQKQVIAEAVAAWREKHGLKPSYSSTNNYGTDQAGLIGAARYIDASPPLPEHFTWRDMLFKIDEWLDTTAPKE